MKTKLTRVEFKFATDLGSVEVVFEDDAIYAYCGQTGLKWTKRAGSRVIPNKTQATEYARRVIQREADRRREGSGR